MKTKFTPRFSKFRAATSYGLVLGAVLLGWLSLSGRVAAQSAINAPPDLLSYQGFLTDANGAPLAPSAPANYTVVFSIYNAPSGGTLRWQEQQVVTVDNGNFSVILGEGTQVGSQPRPPLSILMNTNDASARYIGLTVTINGTPTEIQPRLRLLPTPYAFLAGNARAISTAAGLPVLSHTNNRVEVAGNFFASGTINGNGSGLTSLAEAAVPSHLTGTRTFAGPVGIGHNLATPSRLLQVGYTTVGNSQGLIRLESRSGTGGASRSWDVGVPETDDVTTGAGYSFVIDDVGWAGTEFMVKFGSGNVGIGTQTPDRPLTVKASGVGNAQWASFKDSADTTLWHINNIAGGLNFAQSGVTDGRLYLANTGRVGINNTAPGAPLHVLGGTDITGNAGGEAVFGVVNGANVAIDGDEIHARWNGGASTLNLNKLGGFVQTGITTRNSRFGVNLAYSNVTGAFRVAPGDDFLFYCENTNGNNIFYVDRAGGAAKPGGGSFAALSDARLKDVLGSFDYGLEAVLQLNPIRYHYREGNVRKLDATPVYNGFIAQEVQKVIPEAVTEAKDGYLQLNLDPIHLAAINAIQELHQKVEEKDTRIAALEAKAERLQGVEKELAAVKAQLEVQQRASAAWEARFGALEKALAIQQTQTARPTTVSLDR